MSSVKIERLRVTELLRVASVELELLRVVDLQILRDCTCGMWDAVYGCRLRRAGRALHAKGCGVRARPARDTRDTGARREEGAGAQEDADLI